MADDVSAGERSQLPSSVEMAFAEDPNINLPPITQQPSNPSDAAIAQVQDIPADEFARIKEMSQNEILQKTNYSYWQKKSARIAAEQNEKTQKQNIANAQRLNGEVPRLKTRGSIRFNPPVIRYASGARNLPSPKDRRLLFTNASQEVRVARKGYIVPDISHAENDWYIGSTEGNDTVDLKGKTYPFEQAGTKQGAIIYGFKFMYNPAVLDFGVSMSEGVNLAFIASGKATAMPIGAASSGSVISLTFPITRIDDISLIRSEQYSVRNEHYQRQIDAWIQAGRTGTQPDRSDTVVTSFILKKLEWVYGRKGALKVSQEDLAGIMNRGTMYDLEFLFRTVLGRRWKTIYRDRTADVGLAFGVPLILNLSDSMVYRVRLTNISFSHKSFTPDMIPMYTDVALSFERIPDVIGYS